MLNSNLTSVVKKNFTEMIHEWTNEAKTSPVLKTYKKFENEELDNRAKAVFEHLVIWLEAGALTTEVENYFLNLGRTRLDEGFALNEVHYAIYVTKKIFWNYVDWRDAITGQFETGTATQIMTIFNNYFDLGNFYITQGYVNELLVRLDDNKKYTKSDLQKLLISGEKFWEDADEEEFIWRHV